jgi:dihydroorotate dehydrogenase electron transfer subunit
MKQKKATVISNIEVMPETRLMWLEAPGIAETARPGQFVMVGCGGHTLLPRPFSVHRVDGNQLALLFSVVGKGTARLSELKKGETVDIFGPLGNGYTLNPESKNILLVAGGLGIAPLYFLAVAAAGEGRKVTVISGARSCDYLLPVTPPQRLFDGGMHPANFNVVCATDDGSEGFKGLVTQLIPHYLEHTDQVFACGPMAMYRSMAQMPELKGKDVQLSLEIMMGCGVGVCYGCTIKTKNGLKQVCKDGPVFEMGEVEWGEVNGLSS